MADPGWLICEPSVHAQALAGLDLFANAVPALRVLPARERVVVVSRSRQPVEEIHLDRCVADRVPVVIRPSGGGAVVLAPGALTASIVAVPLGAAALPDREFRRFCGVVALALDACGVPDVVTRGVSDLCLGDRKIAGTSLRLWRGLVLFQLSLLIDMDLHLLERYLPMPSRQPEYRRGRGHHAFVTSLREAGSPVREEEVVRALERALGHELRLE
jgi:lipoate---protein ligase